MVFDEGKAAAQAGKAISDNPYVIGHTKLGAPKLSDEGYEWLKGFGYVGRDCHANEMKEAKSLDVSNFGRRNKHREY